MKTISFISDLHLLVDKFTLAFITNEEKQSFVNAHNDFANLDLSKSQSVFKTFKQYFSDSFYNWSIFKEQYKPTRFINWLCKKLSKNYIYISLYSEESKYTYLIYKVVAVESKRFQLELVEVDSDYCSLNVRKFIYFDSPVDFEQKISKFYIRKDV